ncbi:MAG: BMP family ABC transporter substrate-binding protein [Mogibacterium sp.]|nr:BMP family ABC transporter substrate-binding protein [Mogibacterium sp.]MBR2540477.1 BMP family ABC transporter substrate-binding protein [Mogibacterium sp.]
MIDEYLKARKAAEKEYKARLAKGEYPYLPALDDILPENGTMRQVHVGLMEIPVEFAIGTKTRARQNSFAPDFMPLLEPDTEFAMKWANLYNAQMEEGFNSAIKAYEYLHRFYVQEGNKRVSVSKFLDMPTIMADVMRILPSDKVLAEHPAYAEFLDFYRVCPIYDIECSVPGSYKEIAELLGQSIGPDAGVWPEDLVRSLQAAFWNFSKLSEDLIDDISDMTVGDAFVIYLRIYVRDALDNTTDKELDKRLKRIRKELMTAANTESVSLVESSDEALSAGGLITKTGGLITKPGSIIGKVIPSISYSEKHPLKAAFIYNKDPGASNWIYNHEAGRLRLEKAYGGIVRTARFITGDDREGRTGGEHYADFSAAVAAAAEWGADVVFTPSVRQMTDTLRAAIDYKDIKFLNCSINLAHQAVRTYYAKLYEAKFLAGIVAASEAVRSGSHKIGYFSDYPIYGTIAAINAFAIGAAMIDPEAEIHLEWTTKQNADWWKVMRDEGISVISAVDSTHPADGSQAYGVFRIDENGNIRHLAEPIWKWGKLYEIIIKTILEGNYNASLVDKKDQATNYWWGMISGVVDIQLEDTLSPYTRQLVEILRSDIIFGLFNPFDGELRSQDGWIRREGDPLLSSKDIISMNWLNENIKGEIPEKDTLKEEARETVKVSGVK